MRFAIWDKMTPRLGLDAATLYRQHLDEVSLAEACGFDHFWFFEHHVSPNAPMPSPNLMVAAAAQRTTRIRLGNMVNVLPYRNPLMVAEEAAMLDVLTGGRLDFGVGRGLKPTEFKAFCVPQDRSRDIFGESIDVILKVWADETFTHAGEFFRVNKQTRLSPPLVQRPHPPMWVSAQSEESIRWAAARDLMFGQIDAIIDDCRRDCDIYRETQIASGHAPAARLFLTREVYVAETDQQARDECYEYLLADWDLWNRYAQFARNGELPDSYDAWRKRAPLLHAMSFDDLIANGLVLVGSPATVRARIAEHQSRLDLAVLVCAMQLAHMPHDLVVRSMQIFADEVMPAFRPASAPARAEAAVAA